ncbi:MAG: hypothetical protein WAO98_07770, partial [Alphaproteobacteria bacterium]
MAFFVLTSAQAQTVETYTNQAIPADQPAQYERYNSPLKAGQMTLQDVLRAHPKKAPVTQPLRPPVVQKSAVPLLSPKSSASSANVMMQQGMKSALQNSEPLPATGAPISVTPSASQDYVPPVPKSVGEAPGIAFEPGQEPKSLGSTEPVTTTIVPPPLAEAPKTVSPPVTTTSGSVKSGGCTATIQTWTKTCVEAGYPANFTGKILGETRTSCPDGALNDVWVANSCASPEDGEASVEPASNAQPYAAPAASLQREAPMPPARVVTSERTDASCGTANGLATNSRPTVELCSIGDASEISGEGPWRWDCRGLNGGMTVSCAAPVSTSVKTDAPRSKALPTAPSAGVIEDGICGSSDGIVTDHAPASELCAKGSPSRVSGAGPWNWACSGFNGGQAAACSASKRIDGVCGSAERMATDQMPMSELCANGFASAVTGEGPWNWTCSGVNGGTAATCTATPKKDAVCGGASIKG